MAFNPLEEFLSSLNAGSAGFAAGGKALEQTAQLEAKDALTAALQGGQEMSNEQLAGMASAAGYDDVLKQLMTERTKPKAQTFSVADIQTVDPSISAGQAEVFLRSKDPLQAADRAAKTRIGKDMAGVRHSDAELRALQKETQAATKVKDGVEGRIKKLREKSQNMQRVLEIAGQDFAGVDRVLLTNTAKSIGSDSGNIAVEEARQIIPSTMFKDWAAVQSYVSNTAPSQIPPGIKKQLITIFELTKKAMDKQVQSEAASALEQGYNSQRRFVNHTDPIIGTLIDEYDLELVPDGEGIKVGARGSGTADKVKGGTKRQRVNDANLNGPKVPDWVEKITDPKLKQQLIDGVSAGKPLKPDAEQFYRKQGKLPNGG